MPSRICRRVESIYETRQPHAQNALDIFAGEWTSLLPYPEYAGLVAGATGLFMDERITWAIEQLGGVAGKSVLELGPLEGAHSYMLERAGARQVTGIEVNRRAFLRCLVVKEIMGLHTRFLCGDFAPYMRETLDRFDLVLASGVLYHQTNPMQILADIARVAPATYIWTHYYDAERIAANPRHEPGRFGPLVGAEFEGRRYQYAEFRYQTALDWSGFSGGAQPHANWLPRADILGALKAFGLGNIDIAYDEPDHVNGPAFALVARRPG